MGPTLNRGPEWRQLIAQICKAVMGVRCTGNPL
jgi:hypothetical protein